MNLNIKLVIVKFLKIIQLHLLDPMLAFLFGYNTTKGYILASNDIKWYERSAKVVDIWMRGSNGIKSSYDLNNFLFTLNCYTHPSLISDVPNVQLLSITETKVIFALVGHQEQDLFLNAKQLLILPHWAFIRWANEEANDADNVANPVFITDSGAGEADLVCQAIGDCHDVIVLQNPSGFKDLASRPMAKVENGRLAKSLVDYHRFVAGFGSEVSLKTVALRLDVHSLPILDVVNQYWPESSIVFIAGAPKSSIPNMIQMYSDEAFDDNQFWTNHMPLPWKTSAQDPHFKSLAKLLEKDLQNGTERPIVANASLVYSSSIASMIHLRSQISGVWTLQEIMSCPTKTISGILKTLGVEVPNDLDVNVPKEVKNDVTETDWETVKDVMFMMRVPFDLDLPEKDGEKFAKILSLRHRKKGRYGPRGGVVYN